MNELSIPSSPEEITPEWLAAALRQGGVEAGAIRDIDVELLGEGSAFTGRVARLRLTGDDETTTMPRSLVVKSPSIDPAVRAFCMPLYAREIHFYREIAGEGTVKVPRLFHAAIDSEQGEMVILIEDLHHCAFYSSLEGCAVETMELALHELARFHAAWWEHPRLADLAWMPHYMGDLKPTESLHRQAWVGTVERLSANLPPPFRTVGEHLYENFEQVFSEVFSLVTGPPHTIQHGDFRLDNLAFGQQPAHAPVYVLDWQTIRRGRGACDLAWIIGTSLPVEPRRAWDSDLIRCYHEALVERGIRYYPLERCVADFRAALLQNIYQLIIAGPNLNMSSPRAAGWYQEATTRYAALIEDYDLVALVSG